MAIGTACKHRKNRQKRVTVRNIASTMPVYVGGNSKIWHFCRYIVVKSKKCGKIEGYKYMPTSN
jgi:hypothetical protein